MDRIPLGLLMDLESWLDSSFYETGCFFPLKEEKKFVLAKGGHWSETPNQGLNEFQIRDFYTHEIKYYHPKETLIVNKEELKSSLTSCLPVEELSSPKQYQELFKKDYSSFKNRNQELKKAVLMSRMEYVVKNPTLLKKNSFNKAITTEIGVGYGFWFDDYTLIGSTPEFLFDCKEGVIKSHALAGTALSHESNELLKSDKNLEEHNLVIQNIIEDLDPFCSSLKISETDVLAYGSLVHLQTIIEGRLKEESSSDKIISAISPTAALGGYPRSEAKKFLINTEYYNKFPKRYHGSIFKFSNQETSKAIVMIRNIQIQKNKLILEAGAGVIEQSQEECELNEIYEKIAATKKILI